jgi:hypothetical protein
VGNVSSVFTNFFFGINTEEPALKLEVAGAVVFSVDSVAGAAVNVAGVL